MLQININYVVNTEITKMEIWHIMSSFVDNL